MAKRRGFLDSFEKGFDLAGEVGSAWDISQLGKDDQYEHTDELGIKTNVKRALSPEDNYQRGMDTAGIYRKWGMNDKAQKAEVTAKQTRAADQQYEAAGLQKKAAERNERYAGNQEAFLAFQRENAHLDDDSYYRAAANFASKVIPDGKAFGIDFDENAGYRAVMVNGGNVTSRPIGSRAEIETMLSSYVSPQAYEHAQQRGLDREKLAEASRHNLATEGLTREHNAGLLTRYDSQARRDQAYINHLARGPQMTAAQAYTLEQQRAFDKVRSGIADNIAAGKLTNEDGLRQLQIAQLRFGGAAPRQSEPEALGSTGLIRMNGGLYTVDPSSSRLVPVQADPSTKDIAAAMRANLPDRGGRASVSTGGSGLQVRPKNSDFTQYGALTPWSAVRAGMEAGDDAAYNYAARRVSRGPGMMGIEPPPEIVELLRRRAEQEAP